ncbi:hypothetical protein GF380_00070 [Candidatus Uhrbacteria bacterium]|nr:hypothetical protein [Candidatus Uhrbacteria bacterium]MBD3283820.1 hypothetical protein [Candidatus Uhrbacteria bacterium]
MLSIMRIAVLTMAMMALSGFLHPYIVRAQDWRNPSDTCYREASSNGLSAVWTLCPLAGDVECNSDGLLAEQWRRKGAFAGTGWDAQCQAINGDVIWCCLQKSTALCNHIADKMGRQGSICRPTCQVGDEVPLIQVTHMGSDQEPCAVGSVCCVDARAGEGSGPAAGDRCLDPSINIPSECKSVNNLGSDEILVSPSTPGWGSYLNSSVTCPAGTGCVIPKGDDACTGMAQRAELAGASLGSEAQAVYTNYACRDESDCDTSQYAIIPRSGENPCPGSKKCCYTKSPTSDDASGGESARDAESAPEGTPKTLPDPLGGASIQQIIGNVIAAFAGISGSIALAMFIYGGIMMITSRGESGKVTTARSIMVNAAIGIGLIFLAYMFVAAIIDAILATN